MGIRKFIFLVKKKTIEINKNFFVQMERTKIDFLEKKIRAKFVCLV